MLTPLADVRPPRPLANARPRRPMAAGFPPLAVSLFALATVACSSGSSAGPSGPITANARPEFTSISPAASEVQLEAGDLVVFEVAAVDPDGSPVTVEFLVDGVRTELASRYDFQAAAEGTHEIAVRVSDGIHTVTHLWTVRVTPDVQLPPAVSVGVTPDSGIAPLEVAVQVTGQDEDGTIVRWELDADGDGRYEVVDDEPPALTARLEEAGTVRIRARVTDDEGLVGLAEQLVHVTENAPPRAALSLSPDEGLAPLEVHVRAEGHDPEGALVLHELDVDGDGVFDLARDAPFDTVLVFDDYSAPVRVTLRVTDAAGDTDEAVHEVRARPDVDAARSRVLQGATDRLLADGRAARALTVQLVDRAGRPLPGVEMELASSRNGAAGVVDRISPARASSDGRGELHATLTTTSSSTLMGDATVTARAADVELAESVLVQFFSAVSAIATTISCPATAVHVASSTAEPRGARVTANVRDGAGRPLADVFVELRTRDGALWPVAPASGRSDGAGRFGGTVTSEVPNDNTFVDVYADGLKTSAICVVSFLP